MPQCNLFGFIELNRVNKHFDIGSLSLLIDRSEVIACENLLSEHQVALRHQDISIMMLFVVVVE